jgi:predicted alpha-1,2-mannosidase
MEKPPVDYVDPLIGTDFFGHTYPGPGLPFGMVHLSPDNDTRGWTYCAGYSYPDDTIMGFSHTHFSGTGMVGGGDILLAATTGAKTQVVPGPKKNPDEGYRSRFDHGTEVVEAGYYRVVLEDYDVTAELTATRRAGMHRYTFPEAPKATLIVDVGHELGREHPGESLVRIVADDEVEGYKQLDGTRVYFSARLSRPADYYGTFDAGYRTPESRQRVYPYKDEERGQNVGAFLDYRTGAGESIQVKVGLSYVGLEGARANLEAEIPGWDFDAVRARARAAWSEWLDRVRIRDPSEEHKTIFYTALYHTLLAQYISQDVDSRYFGMDGEVHVAEGFDFYPSFFSWDTYRSAHPLLTLLAPEHVSDMVRSIGAKAENYGWLPAQHYRNKYGQGMVGDHLVPIVVDADVKGIRDYDVEAIYEAMRLKALEGPPPPLPDSAARPGLAHYMKLGYAPCDKTTESVANTLEMAYDDWCLARLAQALGRTEDQGLFLERAGYYRNVFDPETRFMRPRMADGSWLEARGDREQGVVRSGDHSYYRYFDPLLVGRRPQRHYAESNAWQYLWSVQHDVHGLIGLLGGPDAFNERLDTFFSMTPTITPPKYVGVVGTIGQYVHGNQPSHHVAYLYNYAGAPWKTQEMARRVMTRLYRTGPGGICGNEDMGSLSSWYNLSAMGFYPVTPGHGSYVIGSPLFREVTIDLGDGKTFVLTARDNGPENVYVQSARLNGKELDRAWIGHDEIVTGGHLELAMGPEPNRSWGVRPESAPYSMSTAGNPAR